MNDESRPNQDKGTWEIVYGAKPKLLRMKVPGGWLVTVMGGLSYPVTFYPDLEHKWNPRIKN
jgi:hypothetical protein